MADTRHFDEKRDEVVSLFRDALETKLVRWTDELTSVGDFEGRELTLEVFNIPVSEQRDVYRRLRVLRLRAAEILGAGVLLIFHTPEATRAHYADVVEMRARIAKSVLTAPLFLRVISGSLAGHFESRIEGRPQLAFLHAA